MSSLYVYTTEGTCIYPQGGSDDASINRYFESVNFVADTRDPANPSVEAYFRAKLLSGRPEQLFLRFQGDDHSSLFADCRNAVLDELVAAEGWEIQETNANTDPSMLFQRAVMQPPADPSQVFDNTPLAGRTELLQSAVYSTRKPITINGRNYETIADAISALSNRSMVMAVADGNISLSGVGLIFNQATQQYDLALPRESERLLQQVSAQDAEEREQTGTPAVQPTESATPEKERIESELSTIESELQAIREEDVSQSTVRKQLDDVVSSVYPTLSVSTGTARSGVLSGRSGDEREGSAGAEPAQPPSSGGRFSGILANVPGGTTVAAVAGLAVVVLLVLVVATGGLGGDGGAGESEFEVTFVDPPEEVTAGDNFTVTVQVENTGNATGSETLEISAEGLGNDSVDVAGVESGGSQLEDLSFETNEADAGAYTVTASIGDAEATETVSIVADGGGDTDPAEANLSELEIPGDGTITVGEEESISVNVTNVGDESGSFEVDLSVGDVSENKEIDELGPEETETVTFESVTGSLDPGEYDVTVSSDNATTTGDLTVEQVGFRAEINTASETPEGVQVLVELTRIDGEPDKIQVDVTADFGTDTLTFDSPKNGEEKDATINTEGTSPGTYPVRITPSGNENNVLDETDVEITD